MTLNDWIHHTGATTGQVARALGVHRATVWRWIRDGRTPGMTHIRQIERLTEGAVTLEDWDHQRAKEDE